MKQPQHKSWTGGSTPQSIESMSPESRAYMNQLYQEQLATWRDYWGDEPDDDTKQIFFNRAKFDSWATYYQQ